MSTEVEMNEALPAVDWSRLHAGFGVSGVNGSIQLTHDEVKILRLLLRSEVAGLVPINHNPGLMTMYRLLYSMELYLAGRPNKEM